TCSWPAIGYNAESPGPCSSSRGVSCLPRSWRLGRGSSRGPATTTGQWPWSATTTSPNWSGGEDEGRRPAAPPNPPHVPAARPPNPHTVRAPRLLCCAATDTTSRGGIVGRVDGKVAVVTGAGSGIGAASARLLAQEGAKVVVADINGEGAEQTVRAIADDGG